MNRVVSISTTAGLVCGVRALFWAWALTEFGFLAQVLYACASVIGRWWGGRGVGGGQLALVVRYGDPGLRQVAAFIMQLRAAHVCMRVCAMLCGLSLQPPSHRLLAAGGLSSCVYIM